MVVVILRINLFIALLIRNYLFIISLRKNKDVARDAPIMAMIMMMIIRGTTYPKVAAPIHLNFSHAEEE